MEVLRDANFTQAVVVKILSKPPGIGARSNIKIAAKDSIGYYPLTANGGTPIGEWDIGVQGESAADGGGNMLAASEFIKLKVEEPYLTMKINMAAVERGKQGEMVCDLDITRPFDGLAKAELKGLPPFSSPIRWSLMQIPLKFVFQLALKSKPVPVSPKIFFAL